jgi:protein SCO1/2
MRSWIRGCGHALVSLAAALALVAMQANVLAGEPVDDTARRAPHFILSTSNGETVTDADFEGRHLIVFFGYTSCPDVCPTGLQVMAQVMDLLGENAALVQPLFVTLDPARDTETVLARYVASFHPRLLGLTGPQAMIDSVASGYRVKHERVSFEDGSYAIDHTAAIFHVGPEGTLIDRFSPGLSAVDIAARMRAAMRNQGS